MVKEFIKLLSAVMLCTEFIFGFVFHHTLTLQSRGGRCQINIFDHCKSCYLSVLIIILIIIFHYYFDTGKKSEDRGALLSDIRLGTKLKKNCYQ